MKRIVILILAGAAIAWAAEWRLSGIVRDANDDTPLAWTNISVLNSTLGTATDSTGFFSMTLPQGHYTLRISNVAYGEVLRDVHLMSDTNIEISMQPAVIDHCETIAVSGDRCECPPLDKNQDQWLNSTDDIIRRFDGVSMVRRANFAAEPTIRGMSEGRVNMVIDGMKIFCACVDRMDPVSAYVEVENLERIEVSRGGFDLNHGATAGGSINFVTARPQYNSSLRLESEAGYESANELKRWRGSLNWGNEAIAVKATLSRKQAGDYTAGGNKTIANSGYDKTNYSLALSTQQAAHNIGLEYIGDVALDVGYPALLMDATEARSHMLALSHNWELPFRTLHTLQSKLYYNRIDHWMDDYDRDVTQREVMPNMYMPMYGNTRTAGFLSKLQWTPSAKHSLTLTLDAYRLEAFADMDMQSLNPDIARAYLVNMAKARIDQGALALDHQWAFARGWRVRHNLRGDLSKRDLLDDFGKRQLQAFWANKQSAKDYTLLSFSQSLEHDVNTSNSVRLSWSLGGRLPTHLENYGYFVYSLLDGHFYNGNPQLDRESHRQIETAWTFNGTRWAWQASLYYTHISDWIGGRITSPGFKLYENLGKAQLYGGELSMAWQITSGWRWNGSLQYTRGRQLSLADNLPFIPPLQGETALTWSNETWWLEGSLRAAAEQSYIAAKSTREDKSDGFALVNLRARYRLSDTWEIKSGVENLLDETYHEHLSVNNLPAPGRNIYLGLNLTWH